ncbi:nitrous oxide-stimulated promoter family protein [Dysgonomonas sp. 520]|uniref:nitrous oxide-stimulated promoter family protein n=1 Tax=Dysgonomonas sp. 520 TaxID=2302931 RepID=UPI0013D76798|nr:nitrous oxide-stimulated promoter family protein [Dysgonomonas sp. 520]NDW10562.1 nitrous oxide-stimulated promoter family protein [Dysgonomonas sp. 520]
MNDPEKHTVSKMIAIYCRSKHNQAGKTLCNRCLELETYAHKRLEKCCFGEAKPNCKDCPVHCYSSARKDEIQNVMRFSGPRMTYKHPLLTVRYLFKKITKRKNNH